MKISVLDVPKCKGGENPMWDPDAEILYYIDNSGMMIHGITTKTGLTKSWAMPSVITTLVLRAEGGAIITLLDGIYIFDFETESLQLIQKRETSRPSAFNDGKVDRKGRLIIGASTRDFDNPDTDGGLFRLKSDHTLAALDTDIYVSNGPCFSPDSRTLYFSDSWIHTCYAYDYDIDTGEVSGRRIFTNTEQLGGRPDGATVDRDGLVWMALYGAGKIIALRPDGTVERSIDMPVKLVSSVMFGGPNLDKLYVTSIEHGSFSEPAEEAAGSLFVLEGLGAQGIEEPKFIG